MANRAYYPPIPHAPAEWSPIWGERVAYAINTAIGNANCTNDFSLTPNAAQTTMTDVRIHPDVVVSFMPVTANAAAAKSSIWVDGIGKGTATVHHASSAHTDQDYRISIVG